MRRRRMLAEINVVPYVDVMLVLLVIFMMAAPMLTHGVKVDLPNAESKPVTLDAPPLLVTITKNGELFLEDHRHTQESLIQVIRQARAVNGQRQVLIRADSALPSGHMIGVMAHLQQAGISEVGLVTEKKEPSS